MVCWISSVREMMCEMLFVDESMLLFQFYPKRHDQPRVIYVSEA